MKGRAVFAAAVLAAAVSAVLPAQAASVSVTLRTSLAEPFTTAVELAGCTVGVSEGADGIAVLDAALAAGCISSYETQEFGGGSFINCIDGVCGTDATYWRMTENGAVTSYGVDGFDSANGDVLGFSYTTWVGCLVDASDPPPGARGGGGGGGGGPPPAGSAPARLAGRFLIARQSADGSIGQIRSVHGVAEALASLVAAGETGTPLTRALAFIAQYGPGEARDTAGRAGLVVLGLVAAGRDPRAFAGTDYLGLIEARYNAVTGEYDDTNLYANTLAALGLLAGGEHLPSQAERFILTGECRDGGFGWRAACLGGPDVDTTAMVVMTLRRAGHERTHPAVSRARSYLATQQRPDGGFGQGSGPTNANSTGLVLSGLAALNENPSDRPWRQNDGDDPMRALVALQTAGGGLRYSDAQTQPDDFATVQGIPGLAGLARPVTPRERTRQPAPTRGGRAAEPTSTAGTAPTTRATGTTAPMLDRVRVGTARNGAEDGAGGGDAVIAATPGPASSRALPIGVAVVAMLFDGWLLARRRTS